MKLIVLLEYLRNFKTGASYFKDKSENYIPKQGKSGPKCKSFHLKIPTAFKIRTREAIDRTDNTFKLKF